MPSVWYIKHTVRSSCRTSLRQKSKKWLLRFPTCSSLRPGLHVLAGLAFPLGPCRVSLRTWGSSPWSSGHGQCPLIYPGFSLFMSKPLSIFFLCLLSRLRCQRARGWEPVSLSVQSTHPNAQTPFLGLGSPNNRPWDKGLGPSNLLWRWFPEVLAGECRGRCGEEANQQEHEWLLWAAGPCPVADSGQL